MKGSASRTGRPIAERELTDETEGSRVKVWLGRPRYNGSEWECEFGIGSRPRKSFGVDAMQALFLAIQGLHVTLKATGRDYSWLSPNKGPDIPYYSSGFGKRFEERVAKLIDRERARDWDAQVKLRKELIEASERELEIQKAGIPEWEERIKRYKAGYRDFASTVEKIKDELIPERKKRNRAKRSSPRPGRNTQ